MLHLGIQIIVVGLLVGMGDTVLGLEENFIHDNGNSRDKKKEFYLDIM